MSLDPYPGDAEILRKKLEREAKGKSIDCETPAVTELEAKVIAPPNSRTAVSSVNLTSTVFRGALIELAGTVHGAPRTKKNHGRGVAKESLAYVKFRDGVIAGMLGKATFPEAKLNLSAQFYTDNTMCDLVGLLQGFCDALENALVVGNDQWIHGFDGSRQYLDRLHPRVEFRLSHLDK